MILKVNQALKIFLSYISLNQTMWDNLVLIDGIFLDISKSSNHQKVKSNHHDYRNSSFPFLSSMYLDMKVCGFI